MKLEAISVTPGIDSYKDEKISPMESRSFGGRQTIIFT